MTKIPREKRPAKLRDVCILIRSRTGLGVLLRALDGERGINPADVRQHTLPAGRRLAVL